MFSFAAIWVLLILPLPVVVYFLFTKKEPEKVGGLVVPFFQQTKAYTSYSTHHQHSSINAVILAIIWLLLVIAAAKPQWLGSLQAINNSGRDLLLAVDISDSMEQQDMLIDGQPTTRILAVKHVVNNFITAREGDRIGLILFGSNAYLQTPLTFDTKSVGKFLTEAQLGFAGPKTAIGDAIGLAVKRLKEPLQTTNTSNNRVIILLTDGANTAGEVSPVQAARLAQQIDTKIYTIGIGAEEMTIRSFFGNRRINPSAALDEETLQAIADTTGGLYFRARNTEELSTIYRELDQLEPVDQDKQWLRPITSLYMWPLGAAIILSFLLMVYRRHG